MKNRTLTVGAVVVVIAAILGAYSLQVVMTQRSGVTLQGTLTAPSGDKPFGGAAVGSYSTNVNGHTVTITATLNQAAQTGKVFEGWLVDTNTGYKLSLGQLDGTKLQFTQSMVNPSIYKLVVITIEPVGKTDPNPSGVIAGGDQLPQGFAK